VRLSHDNKRLLTYLLIIVQHLIQLTYEYAIVNLSNIFILPFSIVNMSNLFATKNQKYRKIQLSWYMLLSFRLKQKDGIDFCSAFTLKLRKLKKNEKNVLLHCKINLQRLDMLNCWEIFYCKLCLTDAKTSSNLFKNTTDSLGTKRYISAFKLWCH